MCSTPLATSSSRHYPRAVAPSPGRSHRPDPRPTFSFTPPAVPANPGPSAHLGRALWPPPKRPPQPSGCRRATEFACPRCRAGWWPHDDRPRPPFGPGSLRCEPASLPSRPSADEEFAFTSLVPRQAAQSPGTPASVFTHGTILLGGGPVDPSLESELAALGHPFWHGYGMTETLSHVALRRLGSGPHTAPSPA